MYQKDALEIMKMGYNVFLTGEAGTGKTFLLNKYVYFLQKKNIKVAITASTGIAATHLSGTTIDSWSGLGIRDEINDHDLKEINFKFHLKKRLIETKVLIIDEISMIHGKRFDNIDKILRFIRNKNLPFGGIQVILSGDLFQLPPVSKDKSTIDFIFKSQAWKDLGLKICYLHTPQRQSDQQLLYILNSIRNNTINPEIIRILINTKKHNFNFTPTKLYTHNIDVDLINQEELDKNNNESHLFHMSTLGPDSLVDFMKKSCLAPVKLELKYGALVMFVRNNHQKGYVNGMLGVICGFDHNSDPIVKTLSKKKITVEPVSWTIMEDEKIVSQITQIPLRLAWAITVHKSQGMTLEAAEIDLSKSFIEGMGYVALSRIKSLQGLRLLGINEMALKVNPEIRKADKFIQEISATTINDLNKMGVLKRWLKKREFVYKLTS